MANLDQRGPKNFSWRGGKSKFVCTVCGKEFSDYHRQRYDRAFCSFECRNVALQDSEYSKRMARSREDSHAWKGGETSIGGYTMVIRDVPTKFGTRYIAEQRKIAERAMGRPLTSDEFVHHVNGDKTDNRNCNLLICDRSYHSWLHKQMSYLYQREHFAPRPDCIESGASSVGVLA
jgi:endogenous inhibitor of DNA gyrase (YacG/DUF329 family)